MRAALVITSQREGKQKENPLYYKVVSLSCFNVAASFSAGNSETSVYLIRYYYRSLWTPAQCSLSEVHVIFIITPKQQTVDKIIQ